MIMAAQFLEIMVEIASTMEYNALVDQTSQYFTGNSCASIHSFHQLDPESFDAGFFCIFQEFSCIKKIPFFAQILLAILFSWVVCLPGI